VPGSIQLKAEVMAKNNQPEVAVMAKVTAVVVAW